MPSLRLTLRGLARAPLFTAIAVLSLALGIGANTAIFSLLDQVLLKTLPVKNPQELVYIFQTGPLQGSVNTDESDDDGGPSFSYPMFRELQKTQTPFTGLAAANDTSASLAYKNTASLGTVRLVSGNYFDLLGVRPAIGRVFTGDDDRAPGGHPLAILGYQYWSVRFGSDPSVLNQTIIVNGYPMTIVGVAQKGFSSEKQGTPPDLFIPISMKTEVTPDWKDLANRRSYWLTMFGRLKPGVTRQRAELEMNVAYRPQLEQDVQLLKTPKPDFLQRFKAKTIVLKPGEHGRGDLRNEYRQPLLLLMGMTLLVLLIACANVANLQLARSAARMREVSIRLAMGASRSQLIRQLLTESCVLAVAGGALGLTAAYWTIRGIMAGIPASRELAGYVSVGLNVPVLLFCLGLSIVTGILFGLFPAIQSSKADLASTLKDQAGQISSSGSANLFRKTLVTAQIAISLLLLISAGLFGKTLLNLTHVELGVQVDHLLSFWVMPKLNRYTDERVAQFDEQLTERLAAIPGVKLVSSADIPAIAGWWSGTDILVEGYKSNTDDGKVDSNYSTVGAGYFRTMGTPLVAGREFTPADNLAGPKVAIVSEAFVRQYLPNENPLGRHIGYGDAKTPDTEIVGVTKDAKYGSMKKAPPPVFFMPLQQSKRWFQIFFYVRTAIDPDHAVSLIRREVAALDPNLPIRDMKTMQAQIEENTFAERILSTLVGTFAGLATVLAAIGLYGVLAFNVARRTREIGIRMALGAGSGQVRALVVREVILMLAIGTVAGLGAAAATGRLVQSFLFGMKAWDAFVYGSAAALLVLIALCAAYVPARRATNVDPMVALRYE